MRDYSITCAECEKNKNCEKRIRKPITEVYYDFISVALKCDELYKAVSEDFRNSRPAYTEPDYDSEDDWRGYPEAEGFLTSSKFGISLLSL